MRRMLEARVRRLAAAAFGLALLALPSVAAAQSETVEYYGTDAAGSVRVVFDASGNVLSRMDYMPFGQELFSGLFAPEARFGGQTTDEETAQGNFHARQYQARTGRFVRTDPVFDGLFDPQRWNRYAYAVNNPLAYGDTTGLNASAWPDGLFCDAENSFEDCGGDSLFWDNGGGGGFEFGGAYATAVSQGYTADMPSNVWNDLQQFNQGVDQAIEDNGQAREANADLSSGDQAAADAIVSANGDLSYAFIPDLSQQSGSYQDMVTAYLKGWGVWDQINQSTMTWTGSGYTFEFTDQRAAKASLQAIRPSRAEHSGCFTRRMSGSLIPTFGLSAFRPPPPAFR
ncbi:MAG TPA: RHS repeat-associated core domain-containing protein [Vicinamibacterales bacterium]|nr:RHS repeat-associated core domain-containing protein [Vicinamibacterales bacterium]